MEKRKLFSWIVYVFLFLTIPACDNTSDPEPTEEEETGTSEEVEDVENVEIHEAEGDYVWDNNQIVSITLNGSSITVDGSGATVDGSKLTITSAGNYKITGSLSDGQIIVNTNDDSVVRLILNGVNITCSNSAPIYVSKAEKVLIVMVDNSQNVITDGSVYVVNADGEPNAAVFSKAYLSFFGNGTLTVNANFNDGITSKDGLIIKSGVFNVTSVDDGIRGKDYLVVKEGTITVKSTGDGLKSDNTEDAAKGFITIEKGTVKVTSGGDGFDAETDVVIMDGSVEVTSGGGSGYTASSTVSTKGIKGNVKVAVENGNINVSSADDAIHSNGFIKITKGTLALASGDDGIHADISIEISGGDINISKSYEGIESKVITINDGNIHIVASDDGINVAGGTDGSGIGGWPGQAAPTTSGNYHLYINGGYIYLTSTGDGLDANGSITMTNGKVIVVGPTANNNAALDYDGTFKISGGFLLATGSSGMAQLPGTTSTQYSVLVGMTSSQTAKTLVNLQTADGTTIFTFAPSKAYQSIVISSPDLKSGTSYSLFLGGTSTGTVVDGLYENGTYTAGTKYTSFNLSSVSTKVGSSR